MPALAQPANRPSPVELLPVFEELLPVQVLRDLIQATKQRFYERLFTPLILVWCMLYQRLNADHSQDAVVSYVATGAVDRLDQRHAEPVSHRLRSESTSAYNQGRKRLPLTVLQGAVAHTAHTVRQALGADGLWLGHPVALLDGTTFLLWPEPELVAHYGQHQNQHGATFWVIMQTVVAFCLFSGALLGVVDGALYTSEQALAVRLLAQAVAGSVYVGDRNFGVFSVAQAARHYGVDVLLRLTRRRAHALAKRKLHTGEDLAVTWRPTPADQLQPAMSAAPIAGRLIYVQVTPPGFRPVDLYLFTTLLEASRYTVTQLVELYGLRWHVELDIRYVKDTLEMSLLTSKSLDSVQKDLTAGLLAYNLIRGYMAKAAQGAGLSPLSLSFARCWRRIRDFWRTWQTPESAAQRKRRCQRLLDSLAHCKLPPRKRFRLEPRAVRRRPAVYPALKGSRTEARQSLREQLLEPSKS